MEKKRRYLMQPNFQSLYTLQRVAALYFVCAIVQCCWSEGLPNARQLNFGVGSIKKKIMIRNMEAQGLGSHDNSGFSGGEEGGGQGGKVLPKSAR